MYVGEGIYANLGRVKSCGRPVGVSHLCSRILGQSRRCVPIVWPRYVLQVLGRSSCVPSESIYTAGV